jgi:hypothetical protein
MLDQYLTGVRRMNPHVASLEEHERMGRADDEPDIFISNNDLFTFVSRITNSFELVAR